MPPKEKEKSFARELKELLDKHGMAAEDLVVEDIPKAKAGASAATRGGRVCRRWGRIPGTRRRVCLEWVDVS